MPGLVRYPLHIAHFRSSSTVVSVLRGDESILKLDTPSPPTHTQIPLPMVVLAGGMEFGPARTHWHWQARLSGRIHMSRI